MSDIYASVSTTSNLSAGINSKNNLKATVGNNSSLSASLNPSQSVQATGAFPGSLEVFGLNQSLSGKSWDSPVFTGTINAADIQSSGIISATAFTGINADVGNNLLIRGGNATGTDKGGGTLIITGGLKTGNGADGNLELGTSNTGRIKIGSSSIVTEVNGDIQVSTKLLANTIQPFSGTTTTFVGQIIGGVTGNVTGDLTGNVTGDLTGNVTGNVTGDLTGTILTPAQSNITSVGTLTSLTVSGDVNVSTAPTSGNHLTNKTYVDTQVAGIVDSAPESLNTLNELAAALNDSPAQITDILTAIGQRLVIANNLSDLNDASTARTNLGLGTSNDVTFNSVGIGTSSPDPSAALDVVGNTAISGSLSVDTQTLFVNSTTNRVGIGTASPGTPLAVIGASTFNGTVKIPTENASLTKQNCYFKTGGIRLQKGTATTDEISMRYEGANSDNFVIEQYKDNALKGQIKFIGGQNVLRLGNTSGAGTVEIAQAKFITDVDVGSNNNPKKLSIKDTRASDDGIHFNHTGAGTFIQMGMYGNFNSSEQGDFKITHKTSSTASNTDVLVIPKSGDRLRVEKDLYVDTANSTIPPLFVDVSDKKVGIGTTSPERALHIKTSTNDEDGQHPLRVEGSSTGTAGERSSIIEIKAGDDSSFTGIDFGDSTATHPGSIVYNHSNNNMIFDTNDATRMTIDSYGNIGINKTPERTLDMDGHFRLLISPENRISGQPSALIKGTNALAANLRVVGPVTVTHDLFKESGDTNGFANLSNHFHTIQRINRIKQQPDGEVKNIERVQEQYYAIQSNLLRGSNAAFWNWHRVSRSIDNTPVSLTNLTGWNVSQIQNSSNRNNSAQVPFANATSEGTIFTFNSASNNPFTQGDLLQITIDIDFAGAIVAATLFAEVIAIPGSGTTATVVLYGGNYKSTGEVPLGTSQTALTENFSVNKIDTTNKLTLTGNTGLSASTAHQRSFRNLLGGNAYRTGRRVIRLTLNSGHGLELNDVITIITNGNGNYRNAEVAFVKSISTGPSSDFVYVVYGRIFDNNFGTGLPDSYSQSNIIAILKGTLDGLHRINAGDTLMNFNSDNAGRYKSFHIGPGTEVDGNCISIGKNVYNNIDKSIRIAYEPEPYPGATPRNHLLITPTYTETLKPLSTTGIQAARIGGELESATDLHYDSANHFFRDFDSVPNNMMVIKRVADVGAGGSIGMVGINNSSPKVALHVNGQAGSDGTTNEVFRAIGSGLFTSKNNIALHLKVDTDNNTQGARVLKLQQDSTNETATSSERMNLGFIGSTGGGTYTNSTNSAAYIEVENNKSFEIATGNNKSLSITNQGYALFRNRVAIGKGTTSPAQALDVVGNIIATGNLTLGGDLTVNGTTTTVNQTNLDVSDNIIGLNRGVATNVNDSGIIIERGSTGNNAAILWDESDDKFILGTTTSDASSTGNITITPGDLEVNTAKLSSGVLTLRDVNQSTDKTITASDNNLTFTNVHGIFGYSIGLRGNRGSILGMESAGTDLDISAPGDITLTPTGGDVSVTGNIQGSGTLSLGSTPAYSQTRSIKLFDDGVQFGARISLIGTGDSAGPGLEMVTDGSLSKRTLIRHEGEGSNDYGLGFFTTDNGTVSEKLRIRGSGDIVINDGDVTLSNGGVRLGPDGDSVLFMGVSDANYRRALYAGDDDHYVTNRHTGGDLILMSNNGSAGGETERLRFKAGSGTQDAYFSNVNVGIGTTSPSDELTIRGAQFNKTHISIGDFIDRLRLGYLHGDALESSISAAQIGSSASRELKIAAASNNSSSIKLYTNSGDGAPIQRMVINDSGNVGIGITSPLQKLHINGNIQIDGNGPYILIDSSGKIDFDGDLQVSGDGYISWGSDQVISIEERLLLQSDGDTAASWSDDGFSAANITCDNFLNATGDITFEGTLELTGGSGVNADGPITSNDTITAKGYSLKSTSFTTISTSSTLASSTNGLTVILQNTGPITITLPTLTAGHVTTFITETINAVSFVNDTGVTVNSFNGANTTAGQFAQCQVIYKTSTVAFLGGNIV